MPAWGGAERSEAEGPVRQGLLIASPDKLGMSGVGDGCTRLQRLATCATPSPKTLMGTDVAVSPHCVVPLLAEDMGGPVGACAHSLVGWSCGGRPRALPRHFCIRRFLLLGRAALVTGAGPFRPTI